MRVVPAAAVPVRTSRAPRVTAGRTRGPRGPRAAPQPGRRRGRRRIGAGRRGGRRRRRTGPGAGRVGGRRWTGRSRASTRRRRCRLRATRGAPGGGRLASCTRGCTISARFHAAVLTDDGDIAATEGYSHLDLPGEAGAGAGRPQPVQPRDACWRRSGTRSPGNPPDAQRTAGGGGVAGAGRGLRGRRWPTTTPTTRTWRGVVETRRAAEEAGLLVVGGGGGRGPGAGAGVRGAPAG
ncbi:MAG: hypothetical protein MZV63_56555 [Marinilabiliales bacterium]|nr:hypothetical protein [Marinilabiliales bacterium]